MKECPYLPVFGIEHLIFTANARQLQRSEVISLDRRSGQFIPKAIKHA